jgi:D-alanyl-D-alanine carboxypeptidase
VLPFLQSEGHVGLMPMVGHSAKGAVLRTAPAVNADFMFVRNMTTATNIYGKAHRDRCEYPASITKLMTALIVSQVKAGALSDTVTVATGDLTPLYSSMGLQNGDVITFTDLLHGMMLPSGSDACQAAARVVGDILTASGGVARFITEMNTMADSLCMHDTAYTNTFGLAEAGHYTTAFDYEKLLRAVLNDSTVAPILDKSVYSATITGANARAIFLASINPILEDAGVIGGKDGLWIDTAPNPDFFAFNLVNTWVAPNGKRFAIITLESDTAADRIADQRALIAQLMVDFPSLAIDINTNGAGAMLMENNTDNVLLENNTDNVLLEA